MTLLRSSLLVMIKNKKIGPKWSHLGLSPTYPNWVLILTYSFSSPRNRILNQSVRHHLVSSSEVICCHPLKVSDLFITNPLFASITSCSQDFLPIQALHFVQLYCSRRSGIQWELEILNESIGLFWFTASWDNIVTVEKYGMHIDIAMESNDLIHIKTLDPGLAE